MNAAFIASHCKVQGESLGGRNVFKAFAAKLRTVLRALSTTHLFNLLLKARRTLSRNPQPFSRDPHHHNPTSRNP